MKRSIALVLALVCVLGLSSCKSNNQDEKQPYSIPKSSVATFEYREDKGYKLITSEIGSLDTLVGLNLKPSDAEFKGEWIYRITFNPEKYIDIPEKYEKIRDTEEFVVLFGEQCVSIDGITYVANDGVSYSDILNWAAAKYEYFDYELINQPVTTEIYENQELAFRVEFPDTWKDNYNVVANPQSPSSVIIETTWGGTLCFIFRRTTESWAESGYGELVPVEYRLLGENSDYVYLLYFASDVQYDPDDDEQVNTYEVMREDLYNIKFEILHEE